MSEKCLCKHPIVRTTIKWLAPHTYELKYKLDQLDEEITIYTDSPYFGYNKVLFPDACYCPIEDHSSKPINPHRSYSCCIKLQYVFFQILFLVSGCSVSTDGCFVSTNGFFF